MDSFAGKTDKAIKAGVTDKEKMYVIVAIGGENYGIDVMNVNMISAYTDIRQVPNAMPYMRGVITIGDTIVPVIDMKVKFDLGASDFTRTTVIVIVTIHDKMIGLIVDSVLDVATLSLSKIQDTPHFSANIDADCIMGISEVGTRLVIILNTGKILTRGELENFEHKETD
ncbi:MAG: chemotaxis protein CheW [Spirochaetota bacterium]